MSIAFASVPLVVSSRPSRSSTESAETSSASSPSAFSSRSSARRYAFEPPITSDAPASSQSGDQPSARKPASSITLPAVFRTASSPTGTAASG